MQITTVLTNAQPRIVNKRDGSGSFTLMEIFDHEGTAWVARDDVYNQAMGMIGQTVDMVVRVEQKGQYTNRFVDMLQPSAAGAIVPASNAVQQAFQAAQNAQRVQPTMPQQPAQQIWTPGQPQNAITPQQAAGLIASGQATQITQQPQIRDVNVYPTRKDSSIHRQTAAKVAADISTSPSEFWANCVDLARYFDSGQVPINAQQANPTSSPDQQFAAAGTGYDNSPPAHGDDSIPF